MFGRSALLTVLLVGACAHEHKHGQEPEEFDYVIVGGGLAGSVLANRLSASGKDSVLLLNVAGTPPDAYRGPVMLTDEFIIKKNRSADYGLRAKILQPGYKPVPEFSIAETGSSPARWLGGSTLVGLSLYLRDHPEALNKWGEHWSWTKLTPYFYRAEAGPGMGRDYGTDGKYPVAAEPAYVHPLTRSFLEAAEAAGLRQVADLNTEREAGVAGLTPVNQYEDGTKAHSYGAYLAPVLGSRPNLKVRTGVRADRLVFNEGHRCRGVAYRELGNLTDHVVHAKKEVIVSSGYIYSPRLLFLSGLGDKRELEKVGLPVVRDLPAVGKHLTSARYTPLAFRTNRSTLAQMVGAPISPAGEAAEPACYGSAVQEAVARFRSEAAKKAEPKAERADVVLSFLPTFYAPGSAPLQYSLQGEPWPLKTRAYSLLVTLGETEAEGSVTFPTGSPDASPIVLHEPLTEKDAARAEEAVAKAKELATSAALGGELIENGAGASDTFSALYDGRGTCRMGESKHNSVVNPELKVHDVEGLRVVDGSVIPHASPYLAAPEVLALAERAADMILGREIKVKTTHLGHHHYEVRLPGVEGKPYTLGEVKPETPSWTLARLENATGPTASLLEMVRYLAGEEEPSQMASDYSTGSAVRTGPVAVGASLVGAAGGAAIMAAFALRGRRDAADHYAHLLA